MRVRPHISTAVGRHTRLLHRVADEGGYVMVLLLGMLMVALAAGTAGVMGALEARSHANRDLRSQRALQAADAGLTTGIYRLNQLNLEAVNFSEGENLADFRDCVIPTGGSGTVTGFEVVPEASVPKGACPTNTASDVKNALTDTTQVGNHAFYQVGLVPDATSINGGPNVILKNPKVVAVGVEDGGKSTTCTSKISPTPSASATSGCVIRRVMTTLHTVDPPLGIEASESISIKAFAATFVNGSLRTNGAFKQEGLVAYNESKGTLTYGTTLTKEALLFSAESKKVAETVNRPAISIDDEGCPGACVVPSLPAAVTAATLGGTNGASPAYNSATNTVTMTGGEMTFTSGDYIFCDFNSTGGTIKTKVEAGGAPVRIFIDSPTSSRCSSNGLGSKQGNFNSTVPPLNVVSELSELAGSSQLQLYMASGSTGSPSTVNIAGKITENMFLYAPHSNVSMEALSFNGNIIANKVSLKGLLGLALFVTQDKEVPNFAATFLRGVFRATQYTECSPVYPLPTPDPTAGC